MRRCPVSLSCSLRMETRAAMVQALQLLDGATESIFPQVEALLLNSVEYQHALEYVAVRKKMGRYMSVVDFLFCELHPKWRMACQRFYLGNGPHSRTRSPPSNSWNTVSDYSKPSRSPTTCSANSAVRELGLVPRTSRGSDPSRRLTTPD